MPERETTEHDDLTERCRARREQWLPAYLGPWWSGVSAGPEDAEAPLRDAFDAGFAAAVEALSSSPGSETS